MDRCGLLLLVVLLTTVNTDTVTPQLEITKHPVGGFVQRGERHDFVCEGEAGPGKTVTYSWRKVTNVRSLNPTFTELDTGITGSEGTYIEYDAQESGFYFCVITSGSFTTTSNGAYLEVAYLNELTEGPADATYSNEVLFVELQCKIPDSSPYPEVTWYKHGVKFAAENAFLKRDSNARPANLIIFDVTVDDSGLYNCKVENKYAAVPSYESESASIFITVDGETSGDYPAQEIIGDLEITGDQGATVTLYAGVASKPHADYVWEFNSVDIVTGGRYTIEDSGRSLKIENLVPEDDGTYIVKYKQYGSVKGSVNVKLRVMIPISAIGDVYDYATVAGEDLNLDCGCQGSPPDWIVYDTDTPATQWFKDGQLLVTGGDVTVDITVNDKNIGTAKIASVADDNSGTYVCTCFNEVQFQTFTKNVLVADERQALTITAEKMGWGLVGTTISIACTGTGIPRPIVEWYKDGNKVVEGVFPRKTGFRIEYDRSMFKTIGYLVVDGAEHLDSGTFECKTSHTVKGEEFSLTTTAELVVAIPTSPRIHCLDTTVEAGSNATLICGFSGVPMPTITYTKINQTDESLITLSEDFAYQTNLSYLIIPDVKEEDAGTYRADASNVEEGGFGPRFSTLELKVTAKASRMSMNAIIGISILVAFLFLGGLIVLIFIGRWNREKNFKEEMKRLIKERDDEVNEMQHRLQLRSMGHRAPVLGNPLHQLPETRRQLPSFYAANIGALAETPSSKMLPPSLADLKKRKLTANVIHERVVSPSSVKTQLSDVEHPHYNGDN